MYLCFYKGKGENRSVGLAADLEEKIENYGIEVTGMEVQVEDCMLAADEQKSYVINFKNNNEENKNLTGDSDTVDMMNMSYDTVIDLLRLQKYAVVIVSEGLFEQLDKLVELDVLRKLFSEGEVIVFTVVSVRELQNGFPRRAKWLEKTCLLYCYDEDDVSRAAAKIARNYWRDMLAADDDTFNIHGKASVSGHKRCIDTVLSHFAGNMPAYREELSAMKYCMLDMVKNL